MKNWILTISSTEILLGIIAVLVLLCVVLFLENSELRHYINTNLGFFPHKDSETQETAIQFYDDIFGPSIFKDVKDIRAAALSYVEFLNKELVDITTRLITHHDLMPILAPTHSSLASLQLTLWRLGALFNTSVQDATNVSLREQRNELFRSRNEAVKLFPVPDSKSNRSN